MLEDKGRLSTDFQNLLFAEFSQIIVLTRQSQLAAIRFF